MLENRSTLQFLWMGWVLLHLSGTQVCVDCQNVTYAVVYPNGGEIFKVGDTLKVQVTASASLTAGIDIHIGKYNWAIVRGSINPTWDTTYHFVIPRSMSWFTWDDIESDWNDTSISTISSECKIRVYDYNNKELYDYSDSFFTIIDSSSSKTARSLLPVLRNRDIAVCAMIQVRDNSFSSATPLHMRFAPVVFDLRGRWFDGNFNSGGKLPAGVWVAGAWPRRHW
jgi:hypothetical protein